MIKHSLNGPWIMKDTDKVEYRTQVPGTVLKTLLDHKVIPDPFDGLNEKIGTDATKKVWIFEKTFDVPEAMLACDQVDAVFEGLDTLAHIELNGTFIADTNNMHRTWRIPVKETLREGENTVRITFFPAVFRYAAASRMTADPIPFP